MNNLAVERVASVFRLKDLTDCETSEITFNFLVRTIIWRIRQDENPDIENDSLLGRKGEENFARLSLFLYLAVHDPEFFHLAKRMAANELLKRGAKSPSTLMIAARLLVMEPPKQTKTKSTRDALIVMAIAVKTQQGHRPLGQTADKQGSILLLQAALIKEGGHHSTFDQLEYVWKHKATKLENIDFDPDEISEFFARTSPMLD